MANFVRLCLANKKHHKWVGETRRWSEYKRWLRRFDDDCVFAVRFLISAKKKPKVLDFDLTFFVDEFYLRSIASCWQCVASTIVLVSALAASLISDHGRQSDMWSSRIDTAQYACRLYLTWLETASLTSVNKKIWIFNELNSEKIVISCDLIRYETGFALSMELFYKFPSLPIF